MIDLTSISKKMHRNSVKIGVAIKKVMIKNHFQLK